MKKYVYPAILAFIAITICSKSSFLYPFNDWVDANCFFTVGKGMMNGLVPYRDLYEQKGPLLYFIYGISWLIANKAFIGAYLFELIAAFAYLVYADRTLSLFGFGKTAKAVLLAATAYATYAFSAMAHGGSAEELCLPFFAAALYHTAEAAERGGAISLKAAAADGAMFGCVLMIKYNLVGFYIGYVIFAAVLALRNGGLKNAAKTAGCFAAGAVAAVLPWVIYFAANGALGDIWGVYFVDNATTYGVSMTLMQKVGFILSKTANSLSDDGAVLVIAMAAGLLAFFADRKRKLMTKLMIPLMFIIQSVFLYIGGRSYVYYSMATHVFAVIIAAGLGRAAVAAAEKLKLPSFRRAAVAATCASAVALAGAAYLTYKYTPFMREDKNSLMQYRFAAEMEDGATLLDYGGLDCGLYTTSGILPTCKYFCKLNIDDKEMLIAQSQYVKDGATEYIVIRDGGGRKAANSFDGYTQIDEQQQVFEGQRFTYRLYKRD